jgi:hypothetical protein
LCGEDAAKVPEKKAGGEIKKDEKGYSYAAEAVI